MHTISISSQFFVLCFSGIIASLIPPVVHGKPLILIFQGQVLGATPSHTYIPASSVRKFMKLVYSCLQFQKRQYGSAVAMCV